MDRRGQDPQRSTRSACARCERRRVAICVSLSMSNNAVVFPRGRVLRRQVGRSEREPGAVDSGSAGTGGRQLADSHPARASQDAPRAPSVARSEAGGQPPPNLRSRPGSPVGPSPGQPAQRAPGLAPRLQGSSCHVDSAAAAATAFGRLHRNVNVGRHPIGRPRRIGDNCSSCCVCECVCVAVPARLANRPPPSSAQTTPSTLLLTRNDRGFRREPPSPAELCSCIQLAPAPRWPAVFRPRPVLGIDAAASPSQYRRRRLHETAGPDGSQRPRRRVLTMEPDAAKQHHEQQQQHQQQPTSAAEHTPSVVSPDSSQPPQQASAWNSPTPGSSSRISSTFEFTSAPSDVSVPSFDPAIAAFADMSFTQPHVPSPYMQDRKPVPSGSNPAQQPDCFQRRDMHDKKRFKADPDTPALDSDRLLDQL
ncbi:hypothetical protein ACCO45_004124 [Purpureocillium lilacinum]|uniref:Uncharacterized protein n=1 Tax=Purpureocillium lilacinum TaxID=33203 RepID=A0ACC4E279_PURLI